MHLPLKYDPKSNLVSQISGMLAIARDNGKEGAVGNALVGAKLDMRYEDVEIVSERYECRDDCFGTYQIGDSVLFVLTGLEEKALEMLIESLDSNKRVFIYAPARLLPIYRELFEGHKSMRVSIGSIEAFVATTIEELSEYRSDLMGETLARLVAECESRIS